MSAERGLTYVDSSAIVKLAVAEPESGTLRRYLSDGKCLVTSALAFVEVMRSVAPAGQDAVKRSRQVLRRLEIIRLTDRVLDGAALLKPHELRTLDAIHLASAGVLGPSLKRIVTYDRRMAAAAEAHGWPVTSPGRGNA